MKSIDPLQFKALTSEQIAAFGPSQIKFLTETQIKELSVSFITNNTTLLEGLGKNISF